MSAHLRTEAYPVYQRHQYPPKVKDGNENTISFESNNRLIDRAKKKFTGTDSE
jgi:hypothetical protein